MPSILVDVWTDGSGTVAGQPGGWAYILDAVHPSTGVRRTVEGSGGERDATNNRMELTAAIEGLKAIKRPSMVVLHADSEYVLNPLRYDWLPRWQAKRYAKVKNDDLWRQLAIQVGRHLMAYEHVKGHSGVDLNERCDILAGQERRRLLDLVD